MHFNYNLILTNFSWQYEKQGNGKSLYTDGKVSELLVRLIHFFKVFFYFLALELVIYFKHTNEGPHRYSG